MHTRFCLCPPRVCSPVLSKFCNQIDWPPKSNSLEVLSPFRLKLKTVGKTIRPSRYDLNQIPYNYKVEVTNRFKGLDLIDRVPDELWMEVHDIVQEEVIKTIPKKKKKKKKVV